MDAARGWYCGFMLAVTPLFSIDNQRKEARKAFV